MKSKDVSKEERKVPLHSWIAGRVKRKVGKGCWKQSIAFVAQGRGGPEGNMLGSV